MRRFKALYRPARPEVLQSILDHARACRLRADAGDAPWGRLAAFTASLTRRSLPEFEEQYTGMHPHAYVLTHKQRPGTTAALHDALHDLIMEGV